MREHKKTTYFDLQQSGMCSAASVIHSNLAADTVFVQSMCSNDLDQRTQNHMEKESTLKANSLPEKKLPIGFQSCQLMEEKAKAYQWETTSSYLKMNRYFLHTISCD